MSNQRLSRAENRLSKVRKLRETAQKFAFQEARSRITETRWRAVLDASLDAILLLDEKGIIVDFNPSAEKIFHTTREEAKDHPAEKFLTSLRGRSISLWAQAHIGKQLEGTAARVTGYEFPVEYSFAEIPSGGRRLFALFLRDVEGRKRAERDLRKYAQKLERKNEELKQFVYIASHDLQEPLRTVASFTQLLERRYKDRLEGEGNEFINYIVNGSKHLQEMIRSLGDYSRAGRDDIELKLVDSRAAVKNAIQNLKVSIDENKARIEIGKLPKIYSDPIQLTQLFQNLFSNALKFHGHLLPVIKVTAEETMEGTVFSVSDNGIGFDPQYSEQVFLMFRRLHEPGTYAGTGTGLAICKKIVERHAGRIWVESTPGVGTTFHFLLPQETSQVRFKNPTAP